MRLAGWGWACATGPASAWQSLPRRPGARSCCCWPSWLRSCCWAVPSSTRRCAQARGGRGGTGRWHVQTCSSCWRYCPGRGWTMFASWRRWRQPAARHWARHSTAEQQQQQQRLSTPAAAPPAAAPPAAAPPAAAPVPAPAVAAVRLGALPSGMPQAQPSPHLAGGWALAGYSHGHHASRGQLALLTPRGTLLW